jgi:hypothetical protein
MQAAPEGGGWQLEADLNILAPACMVWGAIDDAFLIADEPAFLTRNFIISSTV